MDRFTAEELPFSVAVIDMDWHLTDIDPAIGTGWTGYTWTPVGFSGDTIISWDSLRFQPRFTATAANIGYFWWSNDIGGHMLGYSDDAMAARWFQLGCFSPINRLHSSNSAFTSKEPWRYSRDARATMEAHLRLRHRLVPYLYTWARRSVSEGVGPVRPLYHDHPRTLAAYEHRNTFCFGDLLVVPFTSPLDKVTGLGRELTWLPDGVWYDLPTGRRYEAAAGGHGRMLSLSRPLDRIGVLARARARSCASVSCPARS